MSKNLDTQKPAAGAIASIVNLTLDVGDKTSATTFALVQDVRGELRTAVDAGLDTAENMVRALFRVGKRLTARVDELSLELTTASERTVAGVLRGLRDTTRAAGELATTAAGAVIGPVNGERPTAQA